MRDLDEAVAKENHETCREAERNNFNTIMGMEKATEGLQTSLVAVFELATEISQLRVDRAQGDERAFSSLRAAEAKVRTTLQKAQSEVGRADSTVKERAELLFEEGKASMKVALADKATSIDSARGAA